MSNGGATHPADLTHSSILLMVSIFVSIYRDCDFAKTI